MIWIYKEFLEDHPTASNPGDRKSPTVGLSNIYKWVN